MPRPAKKPWPEAERVSPTRKPFAGYLAHYSARGRRPMISINRRPLGGFSPASGSVPDTGSQFPCVDRLLPRLLLPALIVALCMIGTSPALAQVQVGTLEEFRRELSPGDFISLVQTTGDSVRGRLVRFADTALDIRTETRLATGKQHPDVTLPLGTIRSLERPRDSSRNGVLIGAGVGAGGG